MIITCINHCIKKVSISLIFCAVIFFGVSPLFAEVEITETKSVTAILPRGKTGAVFFLKVREKNNPDIPSETVSKIKIKNESTNNRFGEGIDEVSIHEDVNKDGSFDSGDTLIGSSVFSSGIVTQETINLSAIQLSEEKKSVGLFIIYRVGGKAKVGDGAFVEVVDLNNQGTINFNGQTSKFTVTISGYTDIDVKTVITPTFIVPTNDDERIGMLGISIQSGGENTKNDITFEIENQSANFVTGDRKDGVVNVELYRVVNTETLTEWDRSQYKADQHIEVTSDFISSSKVSLSFQLSGGIKTSEKVHFLILYDVGEDIQVGNNTTISARLTKVSALGKNSGLELTGPNAEHTTASKLGQSSVAGVGFSSLKNIVPVLQDQELNFGPEQQVPILGFSLQSHVATTNIKSITIQTNNEIKFRTVVTDPTDITQIDIFEDTDASGTFAGFNSTDKHMGVLILGNGNQEDVSKVPFTTPFEIPTFDDDLDYPANHEKRFFVVYTIGKGVSQIDGVTEALLGNITASIVDPFDDAKTLDIRLSGVKPSAANPNASFVIKNTAVYITSMNTDISPSTVIRGAQKVPMLRFIIQSEIDVSSAQITIKNRENNFTSSGSGIKQGWLYKDQSPTSSVLDEKNDLLVSSVSNMTSVDSIIFTKVPLTVGQNHFFVLYDVGTKANGVFTAQLQKVQNEPDSTQFFFGGELPNPKNPVTVSLLPHLIELTSVVVKSVNASSEDPALSKIDESTGKFRVEMKVKNLSDQEVTIQEVRPRIYKNLVEQDITSEFTMEILSPINHKVDLEPNNSSDKDEKLFQFHLTRSHFSTQGNVRFDGVVTYQDPSNSAIKPIVDRYIDSNVVKNAANSASDLILEGNESVYIWTLPSYVESLNKRGDENLMFNNGNALGEDDGIVIGFKDKGKNLNLGSVEVLLNNVALTSQLVGFKSQGIKASAISTTFSLDSVNGVITLPRLGNSSGDLIIKVKDHLGNQLPDTVISFIISSAVQISDLLFFPNPYSIGSQNLELGFNLTQNAEVSIYLYNYLGHQVYSEKISGTIGYNVHQINPLSSFLSSGHYYCKVVATGFSGTDSSVTKLAIY